MQPTERQHPQPTDKHTNNEQQQYPEFERDLQRKDLESEGRDYLRANRGALAQAGVEFARNNPDLARKVTTAAV